MEFYSRKLEKTLADFETQFADKHKLDEVRHTVFVLEPTGDDFTFRAVEQEYVSGEVKNADVKPAAVKSEKSLPSKPKKAEPSAGSLPSDERPPT